MRGTQYLIIVVCATSSVGCGTMVNFAAAVVPNDKGEEFPKAYGGIQMDAAFLGGGGFGPLATGSGDARAVAFILGAELADFPVSFVADTLTLPLVCGIYRLRHPHQDESVVDDPPQLETEELPEPLEVVDPWQSVAPLTRLVVESTGDEDEEWTPSLSDDQERDLFFNTVKPHAKEVVSGLSDCGLPTGGKNDSTPISQVDAAKTYDLALTSDGFSKEPSPLDRVDNMPKAESQPVSISWPLLPEWLPGPNRAPNSSDRSPAKP